MEVLASSMKKKCPYADEGAVRSRKYDFRALGIGGAGGGP